MTNEELELAISSLIERHGDQLPDPDHYPNMVKTMVLHELYILEQRSRDDKI